MKKASVLRLLVQRSPVACRSDARGTMTVKAWGALHSGPCDPSCSEDVFADCLDTLFLIPPCADTRAALPGIHVEKPRVPECSKMDNRGTCMGIPVAL